MLTCGYSRTKAVTSKGQQLKVIIDTDPGIDDAIAIMIALKLSKLQVVGITTVNGNVGSKTGAINAMKIVEVAGKPSIPVIQGATRPLVKRSMHSKKIHGKCGLGDLILPADVPLAKTSYLDFMQDTVKSHRKGELSLIAIGPLTNVAQLAMADPDLLKQFSTLCIMGGAFGLDPDNRACGNITRYAEFNFYCDPEAAQMVMGLEGLSDIRVVGLDITGNKSCMIDQKFLTMLGPCKGQVARMAADLLGFAVRKHTLFDLPDAFALAMLARPELFTLSKGRISIITSGRMRGNSIFHPDDMGGSSISVATGVDTARFNKFIFENLYDGSNRRIGRKTRSNPL